MSDASKIVVFLIFAAFALGGAIWISQQPWAPAYKSNDQVRAICREEIALALDGGK